MESSIEGRFGPIGKEINLPNDTVCFDTLFSFPKAKMSFYT